MLEQVVADYFNGLESVDDTLRTFVHQTLRIWYECGLLQLATASRRRLALDRNGTDRRALIRRLTVLKINHLAGEVSEAELITETEALSSLICSMMPNNASDPENEFICVDLKQLENEFQTVSRFGPTMAVPVLDPREPSANHLNCQSLIERAVAMASYNMKLSGLEVRLNLVVPLALAHQLNKMLCTSFREKVEGLYQANLSKCGNSTFSGSEFVNQQHISHRVFISGSARRSAEDYWKDSVAAFSLKSSREELMWIDPDVYKLLYDFALSPEAGLQSESLELYGAIRRDYDINAERVAQLLSSTSDQ